MSKFHINSTGQAGPCSATSGRCPFGGEDGTENHYDSMQEAATTAMERALNAAHTFAPTPPERAVARPGQGETVKWLVANGWDGKDDFRSFSPFGMHKANEVLSTFGLTLDDYNLDNGDIDFFEDVDGYEQDGGAEWDAMPKDHQDAWTQELKAAYDRKRATVTQGDAEFNEQRRLAQGLLNAAASAPDFEPTDEEKRARLQAAKDAQPKWTKEDHDAAKERLRERIAARDLERSEIHVDDRDSRHRYGPHGEPKEVKERMEAIQLLEAASASAQRQMRHADSKKEFAALTLKKGEADKQAYHLKAQQTAYEAAKVHKKGKELDPQMIEALKAKYLKKFKVPFDESGLSIGELLQMAQRGELG